MHLLILAEKSEDGRLGVNDSLADAGRATGVHQPGHVVVLDVEIAAQVLKVEKFL